MIGIIMDNIVKKCIVEETENHTTIHHTYIDLPKDLKDKIEKIHGVETVLCQKYKFILYIARCFDKERILDIIMKTIICYKI